MEICLWLCGRVVYKVEKSSLSTEPYLKTRRRSLSSYTSWIIHATKMVYSDVFAEIWKFFLCYLVSHYIWKDKINNQNNDSWQEKRLC